MRAQPILDNLIAWGAPIILAILIDAVQSPAVRPPGSEHSHDRESWADNLYHFAQRLFR